MKNKKLRWCFGLKDGLSIVEPNERLGKSYLAEAKSSLERAENNRRTILHESRQRRAG